MHAPLTRAKRSFYVAAAIAAASHVAQADAPVVPATLTVIGHTMDARLDNMLGPLVQDTDPLLATVTLGANKAEADYAAGTLKGVAVAEPLGVNFTLSMSSFDLTLRNGSASAVHFGAGSIAIDTTASYARTLGASPSGTVANTLNAVFGIAIVAPDDTVRYSGNAFYQYRYSHDLGDPAPDLTAIVRHEGGFTTSSSEHAFASHAVLSSAAFDLLPGETMAIFMSVGASANVINLLGAPGFSATTDFGHTARLSMQLPTGVTLDSPVQLGWVTAVPEPSSWALMLGGVVGLAALRRRRS
ncbi:PEP-CTERM sorting domain-containing protein [Roseateles sp.]|uniref:PEP-CTERM sorting domain-containing protein n=1 Tax=Roseateles sp. TaxID=1971397 RepID=UPI00393FC7D6